MLTFLIVLIVFSILIFVHELGHMLVAKRIGVRVEKFSLGFGRKLFGFKKGDTEYVISVFPFGGYVKLAGEHLQESTGRPDEFQSKSIFKRFLIIVSGSLSNYIFAFLLFIAIFMIGLPSFSTKVGALLPDHPAKKSGIRVGDHIVNIEGKDVKYWQDLVKIVQKSTDEKPLDFKVERNGKVLDFDIIPRIKESKNIFGQETRIGIIGVSPKQEIIFERFRQVDHLLRRKHEGSGIGLSLIKSLIEMHDGKISVESEYKKGTNFIIELPIKTINEKEDIHTVDDFAQQTNVEKIHIEFSDIYE